MLAAFLVYLLLYLFILGCFGQVSRKGTKRSFWVAPKSAGPYVAAFAAGASDMSSWLFLALPGSVYLWGGQDLFLCIGLIIGAFLSWTWIAPILLEKYTEDSQASSFIQLLVNSVTERPTRLSQQNRDFKQTLTLLVLLFTCIYIAAGLSAMAKILYVGFNVPLIYGKVLGVLALFCVAVFGGAVGLNALEIVQGIAIFILLGYLTLTNFSLPNLKPDDFTSVSTTPTRIIYDLSWGLGYFGIPHILSRMSVIQRSEDIPKARFVLLVWMTLSLCFAFLLGFLGRHYFPSLIDHELIIPSLILEQHSVVAGVGFALMIGSCLCAGTAQILSSSSSLAQDFLSKSYSFIFSILVVLGLSFLSSESFKKDIFMLVDLGWSGLTTTFAPYIFLLCKQRYISAQLAQKLVIMNVFIVFTLFIIEDLSPVGMMLPSLLLHGSLAYYYSKP